MPENNQQPYQPYPQPQPYQDAQASQPQPYPQDASYQQSQQPYSQPMGQQPANAPQMPQDPYQQAGYQQPGYQQPYPQQPGYQQPYYGVGQMGMKSKIAAGVLGILLGAFGAHKFYLGYTGAAVAMLLITLFGSLITFGISAAVMGVIGIVEGIIYLTNNDQAFYYTYEVGRRSWF